MNQHQVIILGSGPAGLTAALYTARAGLNPLVLEGPTPGGQLIMTSTVENWPGSRSIIGAELITNMKNHAHAFGASFLNQTALKIENIPVPCAITTNKQKLQAHVVIIAVGSAPRKLNCPGEEQYWGKGVTICAICDAALYKNQPIIIVGGGNTAMQDAVFMTTFTHNITIVHEHDALTAAPQLQKPVLNNPAITIIYNSTISAITGTNKCVTHATIINKFTRQEHTLETAAIFLAIGSTPNTSFLKNTIVLHESGHIKTFKFASVTSQPNIFACGDAVDYHYRQAITAAASGCIAALDAQHYLEQLT